MPSFTLLSQFAQSTYFFDLTALTKLIYFENIFLLQISSSDAMIVSLYSQSWSHFCFDVLEKSNRLLIRDKALEVAIPPLTFSML